MGDEGELAQMLRHTATGQVAAWVVEWMVTGQWPPPSAAKEVPGTRAGRG